MTPIGNLVTPPLILDNLLLNRRIILCAGAGGVGKTTIAAALAVRAARIGLRVACLTIDPARRLADSLGVTANQNVGELYDITKNIGQPLKKGGHLSFEMLDSKATLDQFVLDRSSNKEAASRILNNRMYRNISGSISGMQEYMALEKLYEIKNDDKFDLIVIDTPPTTNAIDFFTAPTRLTAVLDGSLVRTMKRIHKSSGRVGLDISGRWAETTLKAMSKLAGAELLIEIMGLVDALSDLFGSFSQRAASVAQTLRTDDVDICLVSTPEHTTLRETADFKRQLTQLNLKTNLLIFNQCHFPRVKLDGIPIPEEASDEVRALVNEWNKAFDLEQSIIKSVRETWINLKHVAMVPILPVGVTRVSALNAIGEHLLDTTKWLKNDSASP